ncbi:DUF6483 family protein [Paenibacillus flagellatus]|uniref:Tetratricopeptide repeat protein n=1 Tax=Paenibacillus flagellatus TaxID=2211139 RepID=A0A2V5KND5_9BACL|nr:DUF6483 family protein [Paenibacillus flagellatus]PYI52567.1 hypothetical protein DLM86_20555 [Paenibacillus flagellatus]
MYQRDYILRLIEQFTNAVAVLMGMKRNMKPHEAMELVGETYKKLFGLHPNLIRALSERDLIELLNRDGEAAAEKLLVIAGLMKEEADLSAELGRPEDGYPLHLKALNLALLATREDVASDLFDAPALIDGLTERLSRFELPAETLTMLWPWYERTGRYADAEDVLYELLERHRRVQEPAAGGDAYAKLLAEARLFYERLLETDEAALEAGRLPLDEVREALGDVRAAEAALRSGRADD